MKPTPIESDKRLALIGKTKYRLVTPTSERETFDRAEAVQWLKDSPDATAHLQAYRFVDALGDGSFVREERIDDEAL